MKIKVNNKKFSFFNNFAISRNLDSVASTFSFVAKYDPLNPDHKELFKPLSYHNISIYTNDDKLILTGFIISHSFNSKETPELVKISGYSKGGVLEDCNIPYDLYPLESNEMSLKDISEKLLNAFDLELIIDESVQKESNLIYKKSIAQPTESIKQYISKLTAQRNIVLSHNEYGNIILFKPNLSSKALFSFDKSNVTNMSLNVSGQGFHSEISVLRQPSKENKNLTPVDTVKNELISAFRPKVKTLSSGTDTDTKKSADNELATELSKIQVSVILPKFENVNVGDMVDVVNDEIFLFKRTKFIVKSITMNQNEKKESMNLTLVLPQSFTGEQTKNIFLW